jgi:adenylate cyclase
LRASSNPDGRIWIPRVFPSFARWLTEAALAGKSETALLDGFCRRALDAGVPIARAAIIIDTLHPVHEGRAFLWRREEAGRAQTELVEYGPTSEGEAAENWRRSVFFHLLQTGESLFRVRFHAGETADFPTIAQIRGEGMSDVAATITRFPGSGAIGEMDSLYAYWATDRPHGFDDAHVAAIAGLMPMLALAVKCVSLARIAGTLVETYLGRDAGRRVLKGLIRRGVADRISAVLWYSDLREFTRITDQSPPEQIIPLLDDYAEAVISAVYDNGGDVLKLIGDGTLAIFTAAAGGEACRSVIAAHNVLQERVAELNKRRARDGFDVSGDGGFEFGGGAMNAAADLLLGQVAEEAFDLVDPRCRGRRVVHLPARPFGEPVADRLGLVAGHVVHDDMDVEVMRHAGLYGVKKGAELARAMTGKAFPDDPVGGGLQGGEQRQRAMAGVIVGAAFDLAGAHRQQRLGAVESLPLA